ncbi:MAG TPA: ABC-F family ATP-binding cassette domain-containing protein [Stellaceae bacterium]|nr:ABC-F family ATP-binding cassette domain-containing protein [Stellaceae bacterium]
MSISAATSGRYRITPGPRAITRAAMLTITNLTYRIAGRTLIEGASAQINAGWKVGLVGRNGTGKSTLLDLIRGERQSDGGEIRLQNDVRIGFVAQEAPGGDMTPLEAVLAAADERARLLAEAESTQDPHRIGEVQNRLLEIDAHAAPARAAGILHGLGFGGGDQQKALSAFSGGWRMRVALAAALFAEPDLLLLDEPTNHLDLEAALWLESFLARYRRTVILVSHDRRFLDEVVDHILALADRTLAVFNGGYSAYLCQREATLVRNRVLKARQDAERARLQAFVDRFRAKASKARQAQSRVKALEKLVPVSVASEEPPPVFDFPAPASLRPPLLTLENAAVGYEPGKPVLRRLGLRLDPDDRIALLGANGNGKSTLARLIGGRMAPMSGEAIRAPRLACGFFAQHQIEELMPESTPFDHLAALMPDAPAQAVRARLARFGLGEDKVFVRARDLSGGEKARLTLALATHEAPHLLILDEPTNHLDIEAREALAEALNEFPGAVVLISHDWHLVELVADRLWLVADGTVRPFEGDLEQYRRLLLTRESGERPPRNGVGSGRRAERRAAAERRRELEPLRKRVRDAEARIAALTKELAAIETTLANPVTYPNEGREVADLLRRQAELRGALEFAEGDWLAAAEALEDAD